jgi:hypothetical protein
VALAPTSALNEVTLGEASEKQTAFEMRPVGINHLKLHDELHVKKNTDTLLVGSKPVFQPNKSVNAVTGA